MNAQSAMTSNLLASAPRPAPASAPPARVPERTPESAAGKTFQGHLEPARRAQSAPAPATEGRPVERPASEVADTEQTPEAVFSMAAAEEQPAGEWSAALALAPLNPGPEHPEAAIDALSLQPAQADPVPLAAEPAVAAPAPALADEESVLAAEARGPQAEDALSASALRTDPGGNTTGSQLPPGATPGAGSVARVTPTVALNPLNGVAEQPESRGASDLALELEVDTELTGWRQSAIGSGERAAALVEGHKASGTPAPVVASAETARLERAPVPAERSFVVQTDVRVPVGQPQWSQAVGERVLWLAAQNLTVAELRLDPPDLGPLQVRIQIQQDQASITFTSAHLGVREALDMGSARLRELFDQQGLDLVNVDISDQPPAREFAGEEQRRGRADGDSAQEEPDAGEPVPAQGLRLVDQYV